VTSGAVDVDSLSWLRALNRHARRPDLTIVLDTSPHEAAARRKQRGGSAEMYDALEIQERLSRFYRELPMHIANDKIAIVSGDGAIGEVTERILNVVDRA
jgi:dTMP kinase